MKSLAEMSDEELMAIAEGQQTGGQADLSSIPDSELMRIASQGQPEAPRTQPRTSRNLFAGLLGQGQSAAPVSSTRVAQAEQKYQPPLLQESTGNDVFNPQGMQETIDALISGGAAGLTGVENWGSRQTQYKGSAPYQIGELAGQFVPIGKALKGGEFVARQVERVVPKLAESIIGKAAKRGIVGATAGGLYGAGQQAINATQGEEIKPSEIGKESLFWGGLEAGLGALGGIGTAISRAIKAKDWALAKNKAAQALSDQSLPEESRALLQRIAREPLDQGPVSTIKSTVKPSVEVVSPPVSRETMIPQAEVAKPVKVEPKAEPTATMTPEPPQRLVAPQVEPKPTEIAKERPTQFGAINRDAIPDDLQVEVKGFRERTGQEIKYKESAKVAIQDITDNINRHKELLKCLKL